MIAFLFIVLLGVSLFVSYYFSNKVYSQKRQIIFLTRQNNDLKIKSATSKIESLEVHYLTPLFSKGIVLTDCNLFLCPFLHSTVLRKIPENSMIKILDAAELLDTKWLEVLIENDTNINNKGWILASSVEPINE